VIGCRRLLDGQNVDIYCTYIYIFCRVFLAPSNS
jgi:hypothetical protein